MAATRSGLADFSKAPLERIQDVWKTLNDDSEFWGTDLPKYIKPTGAEQPTRGTARVTFELEVHPSLCNRANNLHGGAAATIFDVCTSFALVAVAKPGFWEYLGVSRTLNCTYLRPAAVGERCTIECEVQQIGKRMATITAKIIGPDGLVRSMCDHGKANSDPPTPSKL